MKQYTGIFIGVSLAIAFSILAFTEPAVAPPGGNVEAPINVSGTAQTKAGDLTVNNFFAKNFSVAPGVSEYNVTNVNNITGFNDLFLKGNSSETAPVYIAGSDVHFYTNGTEKLTVTNTGNVGIGTTGPTRKVDVAGRLLVREGSFPNGWDTADWGATVSLRQPGAANMASASHGNAQLELVSTGRNTPHIAFHAPGYYGANFGLDTDNWLSTQGWSAGAGYTGLRVGNFRAVGSATIDGNLTVSGQNVCRQDGTNCPGGTGVWATSGSNISNTNTGNVGIGTASPDQKLHIVGTGYATGDLRAPIFYDTNDTNFYLDPNGTSNLNLITGTTRARLGLPDQWTNRPSITGDTNYWTGSQGWGANNLNTEVPEWGSAFFDVWGNPPGQPSGTSHWQGIQALHYWNGSTGYGSQLLFGSPIMNGTMYMRSIWGGGWSSWVGVCMANGVNCPSAVTPNLQAVIAAGNNPTSHIESQGQLNSTTYIHAGYNNIQGDTTFYTRMGEIYGWRGLYTGGRGMMLRTESNQPIRLDIGGFAAQYENAGNFITYNPESSGGQARLGAAWGKKGVYSSDDLYLSSEGSVYINDNNQNNWRFDGQFLYGLGKEAFNVGDSWLRLNQTSQFTSGVYTPGLFRADGDIFQGGQADGNRVCRKDGTNCQPGVSSLPWTSITSKPAGFADDIDNVGITSESDTLQSVTDRGRSTTQWIQSPRFEDRDNTGFYVDPAGSSQLSTVGITGSMTVGGEIQGKMWYTGEYGSAASGGGFQCQPVPVRMIHSSKGFCFLAKTFGGSNGANSAQVYIDSDGYWYHVNGQICNGANSVARCAGSP